MFLDGVGEHGVLNLKDGELNWKDGVLKLDDEQIETTWHRTDYWLAGIDG